MTYEIVTDIQWSDVIVPKASFEQERSNDLEVDPTSLGIIAEIHPSTVLYSFEICLIGASLLYLDVNVN